MYPSVKIKTTKAIQNYVDGLFKESETPVDNICNTAGMEVELYGKLAGINKERACHTLSSFAHGANLTKSVNYSATSKENIRNRTVDLHYTSTMRHQTNAQTRSGLNNANLLKGACEQLPRSEMKMGEVGNYILAAHCSKYDKSFMFTSLRYLKSGDEIKVSDDKNVYVYKVNFVKKVNRNDTSLINESTTDKLITLYTCYDVNHFYPRYRIVARGTLDRTIER